MFKNVRKSWTAWLNSLSILAVALESQLGYIQQVMTETQYVWLIAALAVVNVLTGVIDRKAKPET